MGINFFSGDNFYSGPSPVIWWDWVKVLVGPALGVIGAYGISAYAFRRDKKRSDEKERKDRASYAALFFDRLTDLESHALKQTENLRSTALQLEQPGDHEYGFTLVDRFHYRRVAEMDDSKLYAAIIIDKGLDEDVHGRAYLDLIGSVDYLTRIVPHILTAFEKLESNGLLHQQKWGAGINPISHLINSWKGAYVAKAKTPKDAFLEEIVELHATAFMSNAIDLNMAAVSERFVQPLIKILNTYHTDPRCMELAPHASACQYALLNLVTVKSNSRTIFLATVERIESSIKRVRETMDTLRNEK
jgi:hypothetical protein